MSSYSFSIEKQPFEKLTLGVDFAKDLASSEIISTTAVTAIDMSDDSDASSIVLDGSAQIQDGDQASSKIAQKVKAGTDGKRYKITYRATTDDPHNIEADVVMGVREL